jgi:ABC-type sulfate/molybdate transport systems ATPase subunit
VAGSAAQFGFGIRPPKRNERLYDYLSLVDELNPKEFLANMRALGLSGTTIGLPYQAAHPCELQRIKLAAALGSPNDVLILSQPTMSLSRESKYDLQQLLFDKISGGFYKLIILLTDDLEFAGETSDKLCIIEDGKMTEQGSRNDITGHSENELLKSMLYNI